MKIALLFDGASALAKSPDMLILGTVEAVEQSLAAVDVARRNFPDLRIVVRARNRQHAYLLMDRGITGLVRETFHSSLKLSELVLQGIGIASQEARRPVSLFRDYVLPFEVVSVLLLAALVGAVVLARKDDAPGRTDAGRPAPARRGTIPRRSVGAPRRPAGATGRQPHRPGKLPSCSSRDWMTADLGEHLVQRGNVPPVVAKLMRLVEHASRSRG